MTLQEKRLRIVDSLDFDHYFFLLKRKNFVQIILDFDFCINFK
jgi:hypothetical protein